MMMMFLTYFVCHLAYFVFYIIFYILFLLFFISDEGIDHLERHYHVKRMHESVALYEVLLYSLIAFLCFSFVCYFYILPFFFLFIVRHVPIFKKTARVVVENLGVSDDDDDDDGGCECVLYIFVYY
jgi:hypothetical protein